MFTPAAEVATKKFFREELQRRTRVGFW